MFGSVHTRRFQKTLIRVESISTALKFLNEVVKVEEEIFTAAIYDSFG